MKKVLIISLTVVLLTTSVAFGGSVKGYTRKDGTYVRGHERSSPNKYKWDNYGPSKKDSELTNPKSRDYDKDGIPNYLDKDDDNDGKSDDTDNKQYGR